MITEQLTQGLSIPAAELDPVSQAAATVTSGAVDLAKFRRAMFIVMVGNVGGAGTVDAKIQQSATGSSGWSDVTGSAITQITASNKIATLEIRADQLSSGQRFVRLSLTVGTNAVLIAVLPIGGEAVQKPGNANDIAAVTQRLVV